MKPEIESALREIDYKSPSTSSAIAILRAELERLDGLINSPETQTFLEGVKLEAAHQAERWSRDDVQKQPADWFWTLGYLGGKALNAHLRGDMPKALHHTVTTAALCAQWHTHLIGRIQPPAVELPLRVGDGIDHNLGGHGITTPKPAFP